MPTILPGEHSSPVLLKYRDDLKQLPGVKEVRDGSPKSEEIQVIVGAFDKATHLKYLLEDKLEGVPLRLYGPRKWGNVQPIERPGLTIHEVMSEFAGDILALPGVVGLSVEQKTRGLALQPFQNFLAIYVDTPERVQHLDNLLENEIRGVPVRIACLSRGQ